jgi:hypothetical protein
MKIKITREMFKLTTGEEYHVIADYRQRNSKQVIPDNGLVITNDNNEHTMIFANYEITDNNEGNTYVFDYR